jgi:hypothetical protein
LDRDDGGFVPIVGEIFDGTNKLGEGTFVDVGPKVACPDDRPDLCPRPVWLLYFGWTNASVGPHTLRAVATDNTGTRVTSAPVHFTVVGDPFATLVRIEATGRIAEESSEPFRRLNLVGEFTISHTGPTNEPVSVFVQYSGSATPGVDYPYLPWTATIPAGSRSTEIRVVPDNDRIPEGIETLVATLSDCPPDTDPPLLGMPCFVIPIDRAHERATVFIRDDGITEASLAITKPAEGASFRAGETILIEATAIDLDGYISRVEFWDGERRIGVSEIFFIRAPDPGTPIYHSFEWHGAATGSHVLTARAARADGTALQSQPVNMDLGVAKPDGDGDGVPDETDLCPNTPAGSAVDAQGCSAGQSDSDRDGDGVPNDEDNCPNTPAGALVNENGCSIAQVAPCDGPWRSHRHRVNAVRRAAFDFHNAGLITRRARQEIIRDAVRSGCGRLRPKLSMPLQCADEIRTNGCRLILASDSPVTCIVESSVDLIHWTPISTNRLSGVAVHVNDPDAWAAPRRFYRVRLP